MSDKQVKFKGVVARCVYSSPGFKTYAMTVSKKDYPFIKFSKYGDASIIGDLSDLIVGVEYDVTATEEHSKYGVSYRVVNIRRDVPTGEYDTRVFLEEVLTYNQAKVLYDNYPNIIDMVKNGEDNNVDLSKLHGIGEKTFKSIKRKIIDNFKLVDLVSEFNGVISLSMIRKIYYAYPDIDVLRAKLKEEPYTTLTRISGVGFKTADSIILELQKEGIVYFGYDVKTSKDRCIACIIYLLQENENEGNTKMNLSDLRSQCIKMIPSCVNNFVDAIKSEDIYYNKDNMSIGTMRAYETEKYIAETIISNIEAVEKWDYDVEKYRNAGEFMLSDEQMNAVKNMCDYNISILNGSAGSGKSFTTQAMINMLKDNDKSFILMSPTGKAAKVISEYTGETAYTIHRGLGYSPMYGWCYNKECKLSYDVVIVDEFSMCDIFLFSHLIDAIDFECTKLIIIGDNAQLPSVGAGNLLHDFMESNVIPTTTLTKIFRYSDGGLMCVATDTRFCKPYLNKDMKNKVTQFGSNKDYAFIDMDSDSIPKSAVSMYKKLLENGNKPEDIQVLAAKNVGDCGTISLNNMIQKAINRNYGSDRFLKVGDIVYYDNDLVIQTQNNYRATMCNNEYKVIYEDDEKQTAFVANGETGLIKYSCKDYAIIDFDGILVRYEKEMMTTVKLGYAISIHKSQGSSIKNVIVCTPKSHMFMLNSNLIYVSLTRTTDKCFHLGSIASVNAAVKKKANLTRHTFLQDLLLKISKKTIENDNKQEYNNL